MAAVLAKDVVGSRHKFTNLVVDVPAPLICAKLADEAFSSSLETASMDLTDVVSQPARLLGGAQELAT